MWGLFFALVVGGGCTERLPWAGEGSEGFPCFPDGSCDPGLSCVQGTCRANSTTLDGGARERGGSCELASPSLDEVPERTPHMQVALSGTAPDEAVKVQVEGPTGRFEAAVRGGDFCLEVNLVPERSNTFALRAEDARGCVSPPTMVTVAQAPPEPVNVLRHLRPYVDNLERGDGGALTDGLYDDVVTFSFWDPETGMSGDRCDLSALTVFTLPDPKPVQRVVIHYPALDGFLDYLACWRLVGSMEEKLPQAPEQWSLLAEARNTREAERLVIEFDQAVMIRHLGLAMYENGAMGLTETFQLTEIEAWSPPVMPPEVECPR